jgi:hypothetical protein
MGTTYYFARPDNKTLFCMDKAYGFGELLYGHKFYKSADSVTADDVEAALLLWFEPDEARHAEAVADAVRTFAEGKPLHFISEDHAWIDSDEYRNEHGWLREVGNRFDATKGLP